jgi:hypothetical protein
MFAAYRIAWNNRPVWPDMRDFAAFVSLSSWTSPRGLAGVWANVPGGARLPPRSGSGGARGFGARACLSLGLVAQLVRARA